MFVFDGGSAGAMFGAYFRDWSLEKKIYINLNIFFMCLHARQRLI